MINHLFHKLIINICYSVPYKAIQNIYHSIAEMSCSTCSETIGNSDSIECYGFCGRKFHFACISKDNKDYKKAIIAFLQNIMNLQWYCNDCVPLTINGTFSGILDVIKQHSDGANNLMQQLNSQIQSQAQFTQTQTHTPTQTQLNSESNSNANTLTPPDASNTMNAPINNERTTSIHSSEPMQVDGALDRESKKRKLSHTGESTQVNGLINSQTLEDLAIDLTHDQHSEPVASHTTTHNESSLREIHLTNFKNTAQVADVLNYLRSIEFLRPCIDSFKCKKLVRRGTRVENYSFLSFKLCVPNECFKYVIEQVNWPKSIKASEFINKVKSTAPRQTQSQIAANSKPAPVKTIGRNFNFSNQNASENFPIKNQSNRGNATNSAAPKPKNSTRKSQFKQNQRSTDLSISPPALPAMNPLYQALLGQMLLPLFNNTRT